MCVETTCYYVRMAVYGYDQAVLCEVLSQPTYSKLPICSVVTVVAEKHISSQPLSKTLA